MKIKIVNKKKCVRTLITLVAIIFLIFVGISKTYSKGETKYKEEYISKGDTLWSIADDEASSNKYYENKDIRDIVSNIKQINNIGTENLNIGTKILIPTF